ncbi:transposase [Streptomyces sp. NPDC018000]|uniref:transposase n=1 Tax=Streptomyces sp. NPDC018000 TaxID=3365028 RepID=UPI0037BB7321
MSGACHRPGPVPQRRYTLRLLCAGARRLCLPDSSWCQDAERRTRAGVPDHVEFATKPTLAWQMIAAALDAAISGHWGTSDEAYGPDRLADPPPALGTVELPITTPSKLLSWSNWLRHHQATARSSRYRRRLATG